MRMISSLNCKWYNQYRWKWGHMVWYANNNQLFSIRYMREPITTSCHSALRITCEEYIETCTWEKVWERKLIIFWSKQHIGYKNYVLCTLKPHNNQLLYAMKMGSPKHSTINCRRIIDSGNIRQYALETIHIFWSS